MKRRKPSRRPPTPVVAAQVSAPEAVARLLEGNARFAAGLRSVDSLASGRRMAELAEKGQRPFASFVACSDSRAPTEAIFDCGLGDLFITRLAGNVVTTRIIASLEFAALYTGAALCVVMGHTGCGAVSAAVDAGRRGGRLTHALEVLVSDIEPAVKAARALGARPSDADFVATVERENVRLCCRRLLDESPTLSSLAARGLIEVRGALFDIRSGVVDLSVAP